MTAKLIIICGKIGSGKTTFAKKLENQNIVRFSMDEKVLSRAKSFRDPNDDYRVNDVRILRKVEEEVEVENIEHATQLLCNGKSVIFEYGFWRKKKRDRYRELAESLGVELLIYFIDINFEEQQRRVQLRNLGDLEETHFISNEELKYFNSLFEPPENEGEIIRKSES